MRIVDKLKVYILLFKAFVDYRIIRPVLIVAGKIKYPGEEKTSILDIARFFITGIQQGSIQSRARSISFDFFLAIFPSVIFFFTLIPYIPIDGIQDKILLLIQRALPSTTFETVRITLEDILNQPRGGLLSFGFLFALYVSTNGINSLIESFNSSYHGIAVRSAFRQRIVSLYLTLMLAIILISSIGLLIFAEYSSNLLQSNNLINPGPKLFMLRAGTFLILVTMTLIMISFLYYFGPSKKNKRPFISVGSVTATFLVLVTTLAFNYFISNFGQYNKIYGSIGALIVILLWINFNSMQLIIGFELNASIENAISSSETEKKAMQEAEVEDDDDDKKIIKAI